MIVVEQHKHCRLVLWTFIHTIMATSLSICLALLITLPAVKFVLVELINSAMLSETHDVAEAEAWKESQVVLL